MSAKSAKSLSLSVVDGLLAYENIVNKRRSFGKLVNEGNIRHVMNNIVSITQQLQKADAPNFYRSLMWILHHSYKEKVPIIQAVRHLPILIYSQKKIPAALFSKKLIEEVAPKLEGTAWDLYLSFQDELDSRWFRGVVTPVLFRDSAMHWQINSQLINAVDGVVEGQLNFLLDRSIQKTTAFGGQDEEEGARWRAEKKAINELYKTHPQYIAVSYIAMFFPSLFQAVVQERHPWIDTWSKMKNIFQTPMFEMHTLQIIQLGMPALHKAFLLPYPSENPFTNSDESGMIKTSRLSNIARYKAK